MCLATHGYSSYILKWYLEPRVSLPSLSSTKFFLEFVFLSSSCLFFWQFMAYFPIVIFTPKVAYLIDHNVARLAIIEASMHLHVHLEANAPLSLSPPLSLSIYMWLAIECGDMSNHLSDGSIGSRHTLVSSPPIWCWICELCWICVGFGVTYPNVPYNVCWETDLLYLL